MQNEINKLKDHKIWNRQLETQIMYLLNDLCNVVQIVHKDLGHYSKYVSFYRVNQCYKIPTDLSWKEGEKEVSSCIPCQLYWPWQWHAFPARIHPYGMKLLFKMWEIHFIGPLQISKNGNQYLVIAIDYGTLKAFVNPISKSLSEVAIDLLEDIIQTYSKLAQIIHDNGEEFRSKKFQAVCRKYRICSTLITLGHPQINWKVKRLNYELIQCLQRISVEEGHNLMNWNIYICQALFTFHTYPNSRPCFTYNIVWNSFCPRHQFLSN